MQIVQLDDDKGDFVGKGIYDHPYPTTKIMWAPEALSREKDLLATTGDYLRIWEVGDGSRDIKMETMLNNVRAAVLRRRLCSSVLRGPAPCRTRTASTARR
jgi:hypothetical protein